MKSKKGNVKIDEYGDSPRLNLLSEKIVEWVDTYKKEELMNPQIDGIELVIFGVDNKYNSRMCFMLGDNQNPVDSVFNAAAHGIGDLFQEEKSLERNIFNGIINYVGRVCISNQNIWENFCNFVERTKKKIKRNQNKKEFLN